MFEHTIIAISTPFGFGGIGVVRLSGKKSLEIAQKIFTPLGKNNDIKPRTALLGTICDPEDDESFEQAFLTYFPSPFSYTTEDMVEISCHGSPVVLEEIVRIGIKHGATHAKPGEFTLRAYLNGRIDIIQAEAINDFIRASSLKQAKISYQQMDGILSAKLNAIRSRLIDTLSQIEARIEFPDENLNLSLKSISLSLQKTIDSVKKLIQSYDLGKSLSEGLKIAIVGRTNVGKSTLFNALLQSKRAIVTPFPGTTRDYLSEPIKIKDSIFTLLDLAGRDKPKHPIEKEGIKKSKQLARKSDAILLVFDCSQKETQEDFRLVTTHNTKKTILIFNKTDLPVKMNIEKMSSLAPNRTAVRVSALKKSNINKLRETIYSEFAKKAETDQETILHLHQKLLLEDILKALRSGKDMLGQGHPEEICAEEIRGSIPLLNQLTGDIRSDDIIKKIFSRFCIGK
ncbi:MAG: tRNA uridine-5-carboxymethylaminomethyl(34) synthesis GTPase MnmE [Candidatus Aminicenantes bacterium]|nr:tRNA uridine-5-carboxymethylaminomethyl(34) synthesis GTPase MnmE [Candidatus Aminicenantes bacterium]